MARDAFTRAAHLPVRGSHRWNHPGEEPAGQREHALGRVAVRVREQQPGGLVGQRGEQVRGELRVGRAQAALTQGAPEERLAAALGGYLEAVRADPATWRLVLVPHEGAPAVLHEAISRGREAVVAQLAAALGGERGLRAPDPELAAHLLSALADEAARLLLADPDRYPPERVLVLARWFLARMVPPV